MHSTLRKSETLMWEYQTPSGRPPKATFENIANHLTELEAIFSRIQNQNLNAAQKRDTFANLQTVRGLGHGGIATNSKLFYFFNVKCYSSYLNRMDELAEIHHVSSEQLEKFLFTYQA